MPAREKYLKALGIPYWQAKPGWFNDDPKVQGDEGGRPDEPMMSAAPPSSPSDSEATVLDWPSLRIKVSQCTVCQLHETRTQAVFGVGNEKADWMIVGEAPGYDEDKQGEPFVGRAGLLLNEMLRALGLQREEVFIANILKCRPPNNRNPSAQEALCCEPYLKQQIALVSPKIILSVGRVSAINLLKQPLDTKVGHLRGKVHYYGELAIPVVVVYHPAYLLRSPREKHKAWQDLLLAKQTLRACL